MPSTIQYHTAWIVSNSIEYVGLIKKCTSQQAAFIVLKDNMH